MAPKRIWPSAEGMAYARGARAMRAQAHHVPELPLLVLELVVRLGCVRMQGAVREVCQVRACSRQLQEICSEDGVWEQLYGLRWALGAGQTEMKGWRQAFLARLGRAQAHFLARTLPNLVRKHRRRDGCPELRKIFESLKMSFTLRCSQGAVKCSLELTEASIQLFDSALAVRCTFSTPLRCPLQLELLGRSQSLGRLEPLLTSRLHSLEDWPSATETDDFRTSPCGRVFLGFWKDGSLAGLFLSLHYAQILWPLMAGSEAWSLLATPPPADDLDSELGLHDYTMLLTLRSAKLECFSNCFYKIHAHKRSMFGGAGCSGKVSQVRTPR